MPHVVRSKLVVLALMLCGACSRRPSQFPVPPLGSFSPPVQARISSALKDANENPLKSGNVGRYGMVLLAHDQFELSIPVLKRAAELAPDQFDWQYYLAIAYQNLGKPADALVSMESALRLRPDYLPARLRYAAALLDQGVADKSIEEFASILKRDAKNPGAHLGLGRALVATANPEGAAIEFDRACSLFPPYAAAHYAAAQVYRRLGDAAKAEQHQKLYRAAGDLAPPSDDRYWNEVENLNAGGQRHIRRSMELAADGRLSEAAEANEDALRADPSLVQAHVNLISLYGRLGKPEMAEQHYRSAIALAPSHAEAHYNYGVLLVNLGRHEEALAEFEATLRSNPKHAEAHTNYGFLIEQTGDVKAAIQHYQEAIEITPNHRVARYQLGRLMIGRGRPNEAIDQFRQILEPQGADTPDILYGLATAYVRAGRLGEGLAYTREAYQLAHVNQQYDLVNRIGHDLRVLEKRTRK